MSHEIEFDELVDLLQDAEAHPELQRSARRLLLALEGMAQREENGKLSMFRPNLRLVVESKEVV